MPMMRSVNVAPYAGYTVVFSSRHTVDVKVYRHCFVIPLDSNMMIHINWRHLTCKNHSCQLSYGTIILRNFLIECLMQ